MWDALVGIVCESMAGALKLLTLNGLNVRHYYIFIEALEEVWILLEKLQG